MTGAVRTHVASITPASSAAHRDSDTGNRTEGEAELKLGVLVNKLITCPEGSKTFIKFMCRFSSCKQNREERHLLSRIPLPFSLTGLVPTASGALVGRFGLCLGHCERAHYSTSPCAGTDVSWGRLSTPPRLIKPLTSLLTLNCAG